MIDIAIYKKNKDLCIESTPNSPVISEEAGVEGESDLEHVGLSVNPVEVLNIAWSFIIVMTRMIYSDDDN